MSEFQDFRASLVVSVPPVFANDPRSGVEEMLDSMVMRYIPAFQGVLLAHSSLQFLNEKATIIADSPFATCKIGFGATVWSPRVGMKLVGKVNLCSPDHVSLLVHKTFNASIPRHHIQTDYWEFEYGPAENDPEFGPEAVAGEETTPEVSTNDKTEGEGGGKWVHRATGKPLGGTEGFLEFTVIGLTVVNEMLSLAGSIQPDPFSPEHVPGPAPTTRAASVLTSDTSLDMVDRELDVDDEVEGVEETEEAEEVEVVKKEKKRRRKDSEHEGDGEKLKKSKKKKS